MIIVSDFSGLDDLIRRVRKAQSEVRPLLETAAVSSGETVSGWLKDKAPRGNSGGAPPPGDASGTLAESFHVTEHHQTNAARVHVETTQPLKLQYVTEGTGVHIGKGRIYPTRKKALFWPGAAHPVRSIAGQRANDFVSPVLLRVSDAIEPEMDDVVEKLDKIMEG